MTYKPAGDERLVVSERPAPSKERIWVKELARYLGVRATFVVRFAKRAALLRSVNIHAHGAQPYVSVYGAQRVIAYVRALQGDEYLNGRDYHELREKWRLDQAKAAERRRRKALSAQ